MELSSHHRKGVCTAACMLCTRLAAKDLFDADIPFRLMREAGQCAALAWAVQGGVQEKRRCKST